MYPHYAVSDLAQSPHLLMLTTSTGTTPAQPDSGLPYWTAHDTITGHSTIRVNEIEPQLCFSYSLPVSVSSVQFSSVAQLCPTLFDPMNRSTPGLPVHHQLPEFTQTHVLRVSDAIQPSHPLSSPSPPAPNPSQHQGLFQWVNSSHEVAKVLEFQLLASFLPKKSQGWSPCSPRDSQESSPTPQFKSINSSVLSFLHSPTFTSIHDYWKNRSLD